MRIACLILILSFVAPANATEPPPSIEKAGAPLIFAMVPRQSATELAKRWVPIIQYISEQSGVPLQFQTAKDLQTAQQEMRAGIYDIAFINAYYYAAYSRNPGYKVFAQEKDTKFVGILVTRKDSPYRSVEDLDGKRIAFASPTAVTSMLAFTHLRDKNINFSPEYVVSMDSVYRSVAKGLHPAGSGEMGTFGGIDPGIRDQLRVLWAAEPMPPFTFSAHPRVAKSDVKKIQKAMIEMGDNPRGAELLKAINITGIAPAQDSDYDAVRKLKLLELPKP